MRFIYVFFFLFFEQIAQQQQQQHDVYNEKSWSKIFPKQSKTIIINQTNVLTNFDNHLSSLTSSTLNNDDDLKNNPQKQHRFTKKTFQKNKKLSKKSYDSVHDNDHKIERLLFLQQQKQQRSSNHQHRRRRRRRRRKFKTFDVKNNDPIIDNDHQHQHNKAFQIKFLPNSNLNHPKRFIQQQKQKQPKTGSKKSKKKKNTNQVFWPTESNNVDDDPFDDPDDYDDDEEVDNDDNDDDEEDDNADDDYIYEDNRLDMEDPIGSNHRKESPTVQGKNENKDFDKTDLDNNEDYDDDNDDKNFGQFNQNVTHIIHHYPPDHPDYHHKPPPPTPINSSSIIIHDNTATNSAATSTISTSTAAANINIDLCSNKEFYCPIDNYCIPMEQHCDGWIQCSDGYDELNCSDSYTKGLFGYVEKNIIHSIRMIFFL